LTIAAKLKTLKLKVISMEFLEIISKANFPYSKRFRFNHPFLFLSGGKNLTHFWKNILKKRKQISFR